MWDGGGCLHAHAHMVDWEVCKLWVLVGAGVCLRARTHCRLAKLSMSRLIISVGQRDNCDRRQRHVVTGDSDSATDVGRAFGNCSALGVSAVRPAFRYCLRKPGHRF